MEFAKLVTKGLHHHLEPGEYPIRLSNVSNIVDDVLLRQLPEGKPDYDMDMIEKLKPDLFTFSNGTS